MMYKLFLTMSLYKKNMSFSLILIYFILHVKFWPGRNDSAEFYTDLNDDDEV